MDEALRKSGEWPNVALEPGTGRHAATGEPVRPPEGATACDGPAWLIDECELEGGKVTAVRFGGARYVREDAWTTLNG